jgi:hypothetical protein
MDNRKFVAVVRKEAVDKVVKIVVNGLETPPPLFTAKPNDEIGQTVVTFRNKAGAEKRNQSEWFKHLNKDEQGIVQRLLEECAELAVANFFTLIDGVGGSYEGVFEIVAIDSKDRRHVVNPEDDEMLHDLFSEVCEETRRKK